MCFRCGRSRAACSLAAATPRGRSISRGVLCELMNEDGTMTRGEDVERFAAKHGMPMLTIEELVAFRRSLAAKAQATEAALEHACCESEA
jgi:3,4-dihydroxy 2-butanone 4-phosphate synthase